MVVDLSGRSSFANRRKLLCQLDPRACIGAKTRGRGRGDDFLIGRRAPMKVAKRINVCTLYMIAHAAQGPAPADPRFNFIPPVLSDDLDALTSRPCACDCRD